ncbi:MAG TPA: ATP-binding protein [Acidobacteriaceae bacterium]|jgi:two-component system phosphate regulon sensor histidine kinase PhoR
MKRNLLLQILIRTAVGCALVCAAMLLVRGVWMGIGVVAVVSVLVAASAVRLVRRDDAAIDAAVHALGEGREPEFAPAWSDHDQLAVGIRTANDDIQRSFAVSAERREKLEALLDSMQDAVTSIDAAGRIIWANKAMQRLVVDSFGSVRAGHSLVQTIRAPEVLDCVHVALETRKYSERTPVSLVPGRVFAVSASPMPEGGAVVVLRDVTRIEQVERAQTEFVANVSHELRTPLTSIQGYVEMLLESEGAPLSAASEHEFLEAILKSARRMGRLTDDLLALARVESGEQKLDPKPVAIAALVHETEAAVAGVVKEKGGTLEVKVTAEGVVIADIDAVVQILSNLIENALNYGRGPKGARVQLTVEPAGGSSNDVLFRVRDFGNGIASDHLGRLFERFYRADKARSRESGGTGLGLAIAKHLVESQRGRIWVESELGHGSSFFFTLPSQASGAATSETAVDVLPTVK